MTEPPKVSAARIEVERTKGALLGIVSELVERFQPHNLVDDIWEQAKIKGADLAEDAVDAVRKRPVAVGGVVAALTMFLAREPIKDVAVKFYDAMTSSDEPKAKPPALKTKARSKPAARAPRKTTRQPRKKETAE